MSTYQETPRQVGIRDGPDGQVIFLCCWCLTVLAGAGEICDPCLQQGVVCVHCGARKAKHAEPDLMCPGPPRGGSVAKEAEGKQREGPPMGGSLAAAAGGSSVPQTADDVDRKLDEIAEEAERSARYAEKKAELEARGGRIDYGPGSFSELREDGSIYSYEETRYGPGSSNVVEILQFPDGREVVISRDEETGDGGRFVDETIDVGEGDTHTVRGETTIEQSETREPDD